MPAEYLECVKKLMKEGKKKDEAQRICAIAYYKKYGKPVTEADKMAQIPELFTMYAPITKIDEERRMVFGYATTPTEDSHGEIVDLEASFEAVDEWKKWANIKEMHRPDSAVGVAPIIEKHVGVGVYIGAEIVDDQAWRKCLKGVYKGFSIGGRVLEREGKRIKKYKLLEISLVDRPANPDTVFTVMKRYDDNASVTEASGGDKVEEKTEPSVSTGEKKSETEAVVKAEVNAPLQKEEKKPEIDYKAEYEKLQAQLKEMEKALSEKREQDIIADAILKAVERLEPKIKKIHEEVKPKTEEEEAQELRKSLEKMSIGELTRVMLKMKEE